MAVAGETVCRMKTWCEWSVGWGALLSRLEIGVPRQEKNVLFQPEANNRRRAHTRNTPQARNWTAHRRSRSAKRPFMGGIGVKNGRAVLPETWNSQVKCWHVMA
jgi:hypothetical protein